MRTWKLGILVVLTLASRAAPALAQQPTITAAYVSGSGLVTLLGTNVQNHDSYRALIGPGGRSAGAAQ